MISLPWSHREPDRQGQGPRWRSGGLVPGEASGAWCETRALSVPQFPHQRGWRTTPGYKPQRGVIITGESWVPQETFLSAVLNYLTFKKIIFFLLPQK